MRWIRVNNILQRFLNSKTEGNDSNIKTEEMRYVEMEKLVDGIMSQKLNELYAFAMDIKREGELALYDTVLQRRLDALEDYGPMIMDYKGRYQRLIEGGLLDFADTKKLMDFIIDQAVARPQLLAELAQHLGLCQMWPKFPGRQGKTE